MPATVAAAALVPFTLAKAGVAVGESAPGSDVPSAVPGAVRSGLTTAPNESPRDENGATRFTRLLGSECARPTATAIS